MKLTFTHKRLYGRDVFYPENDEAKFLLHIMKVVTVNLELLKEMKNHGWDVSISYLPFEL